jgi:hypothetical protein
MRWKVFGSKEPEPVWRFSYRDDALIDQCLRVLSGGWKETAKVRDSQRELGFSVQAAVGPVSLGPSFKRIDSERVVFEPDVTPESQFSELRSALSKHVPSYHDLTGNDEPQLVAGDIVEVSVALEVPIFVKLAYVPETVERTSGHGLGEDLYTDGRSSLSAPVAEVLAEEVQRAEPAIPLYATGHGQWTVFIALSAHPFSDPGNLAASLLALEGDATLLSIVARQAPGAYLRARSDAPKQLARRPLDPTDFSESVLRVELEKLSPEKKLSAEDQRELEEVSREERRALEERLGVDRRLAVAIAIY